MKLLVIGATGRAGSRIVNEAKNRGHRVLGIGRRPKPKEWSDEVEYIQADIHNGDINLSEPVDAVVSAYAPPWEQPQVLVDAIETFERIAKSSNAQRLVMVGGAGSLEAAPGIALVDTPQFPQEWKAISLAHRDGLTKLKESTINWTYFSPAALFEPGERTEKFRLGEKNLISDEDGNSRISMEDYAVALLDELENPQFEGKQFTIGY